MSEQQPPQDPNAPGWQPPSFPSAPADRLLLPPPPPQYQQPNTGVGGWLPPPPKRSSTRLWVILAGFAVVVVTVVAIAIVATGQKKASSSSTSKTTTTVASATTTPTTQPPVPRPPVPAGYQLVVNDAKGFAFVMPESWLSTNLTPSAMSAAIAQLQQTDPVMAQELQAFMALATLGGLAFALGPPTGAQVPTLEFLRIPAGGLTLPEIVAQLQITLAGSKAKETSEVAETIDGNPAEVVGITVDQGGISVLEDQLYLQSGEDMYVMTVASADIITVATIFRSVRIR